MFPKLCDTCGIIHPRRGEYLDAIDRGHLTGRISYLHQQLVRKRQHELDIQTIVMGFDTGQTGSASTAMDLDMTMTRPASSFSQSLPSGPTPSTSGLAGSSMTSLDRRKVLETPSETDTNILTEVNEFELGRALEFPLQYVNEHDLRKAAQYGDESKLRSLLSKSKTSLGVLAGAVVTACCYRQCSTLKLLLQHIDPGTLMFCKGQLDGSNTNVNALMLSVFLCVQSDLIDCLALLLSEESLLLELFYDSFKHPHQSQLDTESISEDTWIFAIGENKQCILKLLVGLLHYRYPFSRELQSEAKNSFHSLIEWFKDSKDGGMMKVIELATANPHIMKLFMERGLVDPSFMSPDGKTYLGALVSYFYDQVPRRLVHSQNVARILAAHIQHKLPEAGDVVNVVRLLIHSGCLIEPKPGHPTYEKGSDHYGLGYRCYATSGRNTTVYGPVPGTFRYTGRHGNIDIDIIYKVASLAPAAVVWEFLDAAPLPWYHPRYSNQFSYTGRQDSPVPRMLLLSGIDVVFKQQRKGEEEVEVVKELLTLYDMCRTVIRLHLPRKRLRAARNLPLPSMLAESVALLDLGEPDLATYEQVTFPNNSSELLLRKVHSLYYK